jgi:hypothetical protein
VQKDEQFRKKMPVTAEHKADQHAMTTDLWRPLEKLRQQVDHLFDDFNRGASLSPFSRGLFDVEPFWRRELHGPLPGNRQGAFFICRGSLVGAQAPDVLPIDRHGAG